MATTLAEGDKKTANVHYTLADHECIDGPLFDEGIGFGNEEKEDAESQTPEQW